MEEITVKKMLKEELTRTKAALIISELSIAAFDKAQMAGAYAEFISARKKELQMTITLSKGLINELEEFLKTYNEK